MSRILSPGLLDRIDSLKSKIDSSRLEEFVDDISERISRQVLENAPLQDSDNRDRAPEVLKNFRVAWSYAMEHISPSFNLIYLQEVAGRAEPALADGKTYAPLRNSSARFAHVNYTPPSDEMRIRIDLEKILKSIEGTGLHPLEESIFLYFHLARSQPFNNSNKRVANIIMNTSLLREGFAPIPIPRNEEDLFKQYFEGALTGFGEDLNRAIENSLKPYLDPGINQRQFYEYLAQKEESNLSRVINDLNELSEYSIRVDAKSPNSVYLLKKCIAGWFHRDRESRPFKQVVDAKKGKIKLVGEIPLYTLQMILEKTKSRGIKAYKIDVIKKKG